MQRVLLTLLLALFATGLPGFPKEEPGTPLGFTNVTVIDCTGAPAKPTMTVIVTGGRINEIGKTGEIAIPEDAHVIDASGKFMIPGLWDMHVHDRFWADGLFLANGVTGTRIMFGDADLVSERDKPGAIEGRYVGRVQLKDSPRIPFLRKCVASPIIDGPMPNHAGSRVVGDPLQARQAVREFKQQGYDFLKVYSRLPREAYFAIVEEAKKQAIPFAGHVPYSVTAAEASDAGQSSIEHLTEVHLACSSKEGEIRKQGANRKRRARDTYDRKKAQSLFVKFAKNGTWHVPTLTLLKASAYTDRDNVVRDPRLRFVERRENRRWQEDAKRHVAGTDFRQQRQDFQQDLQIVGEMHKAGVRILAGTDMGNFFCMPGFSLHDELELLVESGLSPIEALQSATRSPAEYLGRLKELGTVERGKLADLVILNSDPLRNINAVRDISCVVFAGKFYSRKQLERILAERDIENQILDIMASTDAEKIAMLGKHQSIRDVESLSLRRLRVSDSSLRFLPVLPELRSLDLVNTQVSDQGLEHVAKLTKLHTLKLHGQRIGDEGLEKLTSMKRLDEGLRHLAVHDELKLLSIGRTQITDAGLRFLSSLQQLEHLGISGAQISDAGLPHILKLPNLKKLTLRNSKVTDEGVVQLKALRNLEELALEGTAVTDASVATLLVALPKLRVTR